MKLNKYVNTYCTGCGLCHSIMETELKETAKGFPTVDLSEKDDVRFYRNICPVFYYNEEVNFYLSQILAYDYSGEYFSCVLYVCSE